MDILEHIVYNKDTYKLEIEQYNVPKFLPRVQVYRKRTETHLGKRGERISTDAICIDVPFSFRGLFCKIISNLQDGSNGLEFCDRTMQYEWRTESAYDGLIVKHYKYLANHEMLQLRNLEQGGLDRTDDELRDIKEVKKIYKTPYLERTGKCILVVENKFKNSYIEKINNILRGMIQNVNWKFDNSPNQIKNASEQLSPKFIAKFNKEYENKPDSTAWNFTDKNVDIVAMVTSGEPIW